MSQTIGSSRPPSAASSNGRPTGLDVPTAVRAKRPGWRDPRLWVGIAIVAASVLLGAKVIGDADRSVAVWAVTSDMGTGDELTAEDVAARDVRFVQSSDADGYLSAEEPLPDEARLNRDVGAGELLPRSALADDAEVAQQTLTFQFEGPGVPDGLAQGDRVDVFVTSTDQGSAQGTAAGSAGAAGGAQGGSQGAPTAPRPSGTLVLEDLVVTAIGGAEAGLGGSTARTVTVGVPADVPVQDLGAAVQAAKTDHVFLVKQG